MAVVVSSSQNDVAIVKAKGGDIKPHRKRMLKEDLEKNLRATLSATFSKMEIVTREEFDIQASLLSRTREKLETLQEKLSELEKQLDKNRS